MLYRRQPEPLTTAARWVADVGAQWDSRLDRLQRHVDVAAQTRAEEKA